MKTNDKESVGRQGQHGQARKRRIDVVTGATSGVGLRLIKRLLEDGDEVRAIVLHGTDGGVSRLPSGVIPYVADIRLSGPDDEKHIKEACTGADCVFHLAGMTDLRAHRARDEEYIKVNVIGTENVLKGYVDANPQDKPMRFIFLSSVSVYGSRRPGETITEDSETRPTGAYGESKLMGELVVKSFGDAHRNIKYTVLRASNMYGPFYETPFNKIFKYIKEQKIRLIGSGNNHLSLVHVDDVVDALIAAADSPMADNQVFNISDGDDHTQKDLYTKAAEFLGVPPIHKHVHPVLAAIRASLFSINSAELKFLMSDRIISIAKIKRDLGISPKRSIDNNGRELVDEFLKKYREKPAV